MTGTSLRWSAPSLRSDSDSELSPSDSGEEADEDGEDAEQQVKKGDEESVKTARTAKEGSSAALYKTPAKKSKTGRDAPSQPTMVEEYFEAHGSTKVLTSDRTLERLHTPKLDRVGARRRLFWKILNPSLSAALFCVCRRRWSNSWKENRRALLKRSNSSTKNTRGTLANGCCSYSECFCPDSAF